MTVFPLVRTACFTFSASYVVFMERAGLNMLRIRPVYTFKDNDVYTDPDLDSVLDWTRLWSRPWTRTRICIRARDVFDVKTAL